MDLQESHAGGQIGLPNNSETKCHHLVHQVSSTKPSTRASSSTVLLSRGYARPSFSRQPLRPPHLLRELTRQCEGSQDDDDDVCSSVDLDEDEDSEGSPHESDLDFVASDEDVEESCDLEEKSQSVLSMNDGFIPRPSVPGLSQVRGPVTEPETMNFVTAGTYSGMLPLPEARAPVATSSSPTQIPGLLPTRPTRPVTLSQLHPCMRSHPTTLGDCLTFPRSKSTSLGSAGGSIVSDESDSTLCHALLYEHLARTHSLSCPVVHREAM